MIPHPLEQQPRQHMDLEEELIAQAGPIHQPIQPEVALEPDPQSLRADIDLQCAPNGEPEEQTEEVKKKRRRRRRGKRKGQKADAADPANAEEQDSGQSGSEDDSKNGPILAVPDEALVAREVEPDGSFSQPWRPRLPKQFDDLDTNDDKKDDKIDDKIEKDGKTEKLDKGRSDWRPSLPRSLAPGSPADVVTGPRDAHEMLPEESKTPWQPTLRVKLHKDRANPKGSDGKTSASCEEMHWLVSLDFRLVQSWSSLWLGP